MSLLSSFFDQTVARCPCVPPCCALVLIAVRNSLVAVFFEPPIQHFWLNPSETIYIRHISLNCSLHDSSRCVFSVCCTPCCTPPPFLHPQIYPSLHFANKQRKLIIPQILLQSVMMGISVVQKGGGGGRGTTGVQKPENTQREESRKEQCKDICRIYIVSLGRSQEYWPK